MFSQDVRGIETANVAECPPPMEPWFQSSWDFAIRKLTYSKLRKTKLILMGGKFGISLALKTSLGTPDFLGSLSINSMYLI